MNTIFHKSETRGYANHGWLKARHSFSFAGYYNPERMNFGALRVLNDDFIAPGMGFDTHPHDNMEIITIPLEGELEHKDSMDNTSVIRRNDIQVMSAGTGILHSEFNYNKDKPLKLLQIWVFPNKKNVKPRYDQITLEDDKTRNKFYQIVSPHPNDDGVWIHQNAWFYIGDFNEDTYINYKPKNDENGVYIFLISGEAVVENQRLKRRDGLGVTNAVNIRINALRNSKILLMEVPMEF